MLILTRKPGERVLITTASGEEIVLELIGIRGKQAKVGFQSNRASVTIIRTELLDDDAPCNDPVLGRNDRAGGYRRAR